MMPGKPFILLYARPLPAAEPRKIRYNSNTQMTEVQSGVSWICALDQREPISVETRITLVGRETTDDS